MKTPAMMLLLGGCSIGLDPQLPLDRDSGDPVVIDSGEESDADTDSDTDADTDIDIDPDLADLDITSISPPYGTTAGGSSVVIQGGPFDSSALVYFGEEVAGVSNISGSSITAITPSVSAEGTRNVSVVTDTHGGKLKDAFDYYEDGTGLAGAIGAVFWYDYVGNYWKSTGGTSGYAEMTFTVPIDFHYWEFYVPAMDTCQPYDGGYAYSGELYIYDLDVSALTITPSSGSATSMAWDESTLFFATDPIAANQYTKNAWYDLQVPGSGPLADMAVEDILRTSSDVTITQPAIQGNNPPNITRNQSFRWTAGFADWIVIYMLMIDDSNTGIEQGIVCVVSDDGAFDVSTGEWSSWTPGRQVNILFTPVREETTILPHNNSESRVAGMYQMVGAGFSQ